MGTVKREEAPAGHGSESSQEGRYVTLAEVAECNTERKIWIVIHGRVYDVTSFLQEWLGVATEKSLPCLCIELTQQMIGGEEVLLEQGGKDATESFEDVGHSLDAREMLKQYLVGEIHPSETSKIRLINHLKFYKLWARLSNFPAPRQLQCRPKVPNKSPSNEPSFWAVWLIPILGALVLGLMYRYYVMDGK